ncbi:hypothetical protein [Natrinema versiforme]|uniref:Coiled-coil protein n=1 Tax=Natrinema versiforme JCM 10478 TaxID=1227496 RepID=L9XWK2_9EURY|nr:hypothetical protein [Natrinema versiforme]ELY65892.1 coiled-coil protein [Natrinema versiforme JCM 10478]
MQTEFGVGGATAAVRSGGGAIETWTGATGWTERSGAVLSLADDPTALALIAAVLAVVGAAVVVRVRSGTETNGSDATDRSSGESAGSDIETERSRETVADRIGESTLERLEPIVPDAVDRVHEVAFDDREPDPAAIDRAERDLRRALEDALTDGRFDAGLTAPDGERYEIVNLPSRYRELAVPPSGETVHIGSTEAAVRDRLEDGTLREAAATAAAVDDHREEIRQYVRRREGEIVDLRDEIEATLDDIRELVDRLEGSLADRVDDFVLSGRHDEVEGVAEIERDVSDATRSLHRCSFDDAKRELRDAREAADELLITVDLLGGLVGTIEHGSGTVELPTAVSTALVSDLVPIIERQYDVDASVEGDAIVISERNALGGEGDTTGAAGEPARGGDGSSARERTPTGGSTASAGTRDRVTTESVADEILFVLRELDGDTGGDTVQCQTEQLPTGVAQPAVLEELATFCRRQTDIVAAVDLQEGAPPGFLEIEFTDRTTPAGGLETLRERFAERHGG